MELRGKGRKWLVDWARSEAREEIEVPGRANLQSEGRAAECQIQSPPFAAQMSDFWQATTVQYVHHPRT